MDPKDCAHPSGFFHSRMQDLYYCGDCLLVVTHEQAEACRQMRDNGTKEPKSFAVQRAAKLIAAAGGPFTTLVGTPDHLA